jgi:hypothetical protein
MPGLCIYFISREIKGVMIYIQPKVNLIAVMRAPKHFGLARDNGTKALVPIFEIINVTVA